MLKSALLDAIRTEIRKHDLSHLRGRQDRAARLPLCRKRFYTVPQFIDHITEDVLPALLDRLSIEKRS